MGSNLLMAWRWLHWLMNIIRLTLAEVAASNHNVTKTTNSIFTTCLPAHLCVCPFSPPAVFMLSQGNLEACLSGSPRVHQTSSIIFNAERSEGSDMKEQIKAKSMKDGRRSLSSCPRWRSTHLETHTWAQQVTLRVNLRTWGWWEESQLLFTLSKHAGHRLSCFQHFSTKLQLRFIQPVQAEINLACFCTTLHESFWMI